MIHWDIGTRPQIPGSGLTPPPEYQTWDLPPPRPRLLASGGHNWRPVQTCSLGGDLTPPMVLTASGGAATETRTVGKRAVRSTRMLSCVKLFVLGSMNIMDSIH